MQQSGGSHSQFGGGQPQTQPQPQPPPPMVDPQSNMVVEEASPISSRPPAGGNLDEVFHEAEALAAAGDEPDRGGASGGNRWPRQETLALIRIRSEMDATFRDATLKGPLWEDVSRKLAELGYKRSAKKCKEKFENVHKYYKRTKEGRAGRQDGKNYKFFSELEALHGGTAASTPTSLGTAPPVATATFSMTPTVPTTTTTSAPAASLFQSPPSGSGTIVFSGPAPVSTVRVLGPAPVPPPQLHILRPESSPAAAPGAVSGSIPARTSSPAAVNFSSNGSSSPGSEDDEDTEEIEGDPSNTAASSRKRKREAPITGGSSTRQMMEFFEGLLKQAIEKQEAMQRRFFEAMERREQDRMIREEAWRRQEMARLSREHELMAQDRAAAASRDAAIISFLQQITGQTIPLPQNVTVPTSAAPLTPPPSAPPPASQPQPQTTHIVSAPHALSSPQQQQPPPPPPSYHQQQQYQHQNVSTEVIAAIPEQQVPPKELVICSGSGEPSSSRWPKAEVLALIKLRSELEVRYQEAGPKGPLWEEIASGMQKLGYKRNAKRCKEKWENINKYFKKVKESNKKRPNDSKTCPYFHQLDALYKNKVISGGAGGGSNGGFSANIGGAQVQHRTDVVQGVGSEPQAVVQTGGDMDSKHAEGNGMGNKPEDTVKEMMEQQQNHQTANKPNEPYSDNLDLEEEEEEDDIDEDEEDDEEMEDSKMDYKIEFQRQNAGSRNGGGNGQPSFMAMVQ